MVHWTPYRVLRAGWLLFYVGWPHVGALIASGGETILRGSSPAPYLEAMGWTEYGYAVTDRFFMQPGLAPVRALPFLVGAPIGFALALPGFATGSHAIRVIVAISSAIALASLTVALAAAQFSRAKGVLLSIELHPSWHVVVLQNTVATDGLWDVAMDLCPYVMCVLLARSAYGAPASGRFAAPMATALMRGCARSASGRTFRQRERSAQCVNRGLDRFLVESK